MNDLALGPRYHVLRELGKGGMGRVLLVLDSHLGTELALKLLLDAPHEPGAIEEFQREFALLAKIEHPSIARAHDFGYLDDHPYFTSEFVPGDPLGKSGPILDPGDLLARAIEIARALAFLHQSGILHLDVKPQNIIVRPEGGGPRAVLIDFGLFRPGFSIAAGGRLRGSLPYMGPEHFQGGPLGPPTDVYALGVTLYRVATGRFPRPWARPGSGREPDDGLWDPAPVPPSRHAPGLPHDLDNLILKCLALDPALRFPTAGVLLRALEGLAGAAPPEVPAPPPLLTVGREPELDRVRRYLEALARGRADAGAAAASAPAALLITGPRGMGQSHLFREVKVHAQTRGLRCFLETGYEGRTEPPGSLLRPLGALIGGPDSSARSRWEAFLARLGRPRRLIRDQTSDAERRLVRAGEVARIAAVVREPVALAVDGLQHWDEISIELLLHLARFLGEQGAGKRPPVGLVLGYREEGTSVGLLRELTECLLAPGEAEVITLRPLELAESLELYRRWGGGGEGARGFGIYQETSGSPAAIVALTPAGRRGLGSSAALPPGRAPREGPERSSREEKRLLLTLDLLRRPSSAAELSALARVPRRRAAVSLARLAREGLVLGADLGGGRQGWSPGPAARALIARAPAVDRRRAHRSIARELSRRISGDDDPALPECAHQFRLSGDGAQFVKHGLRAAHYLKSTHQNRAALDLLREIAAAAPRSRRRLRFEVALHLAELEARVGDLDGGIQSLKDLLAEGRDLPPGGRARAILRLATLHGRRGDFRRAESLFREGLARASRLGLGKDEELYFLNELAALKVFTGEYAEAVRVCEEGLRLAGRARSLPVRQVALNLYATRANVALRTHDHPAAIRDFETALQIAESIGSPANQSVVLNNLAIVYSNCDRYEEAIRAFGEAERISIKLDEGPTLLSIYGNLAVLHAKTGDFAAAEQSLAEGERLHAGASGSRQSLFLKHARGLSLLYQGRYGEARLQLEEAVKLSEQVGDKLLAATDAIYRAEALVFEGGYGEAARELERLSAGGGPAWVRRMALARLAFLRALTGEREEGESAARRCEGLAGERPIPFLDAWEALFLGWALSLGAAGGPAPGADGGSGAEDRARPLLDRAEGFLRRHGLGPAAALARWVRAEERFLAGDPRGARALLEGEDLPGNRLLAVLRPLLLARLELSGPAGGAERSRAADLLSEAGAALVGNRLPEWEARLEALRAALRGGGEDARGDEERWRGELRRELPEEARRRHRELPHWKLWTRVGVRDEGMGKLRSREAPGEAAAETAPETTSSERTAALAAGAADLPRAGLVARSQAMLRVVAVLDRLRGVDLPVLIQGETGSGKELLSRLIHAESPRARGPFLIVDCAAIPAGLLEVELFGARAGAFTDLSEDRPGMLALAAGGTVLIDEVAGAPLEAQAKLLRVLSQSSYRRLGDSEETRLDARFLFTASLDLETEVEEGRLRQDLLHRLRVLSVRMPPLRERPEDFPVLAERFLREGKGPMPQLGSGVIERLRERPWPGNVRELRNLLARLKLEHPERISLEAVEAACGEPETRTIFPRNLLAGGCLPDLKSRLERDYLVYHLRRLGGDSAALSRFLGLGRPALYRLLRQNDIKLRSEKRKH